MGGGKTGTGGRECVRKRGQYGTGWDGNEAGEWRQKDENIKPSTHTQTVHSPGGRSLQMAPSYVWLLIKASHLSISVCRTAPSLICLPHPSACLYIIHTLTHTHTHSMQTDRHTHTPLSKSLCSGESPGFDQGLFDTVIWSETLRATPSLAAASASVYLNFYLYSLSAGVRHLKMEAMIHSCFPP